MLNFILYIVSITGILVLLWAALSNNKNFLYILFIVKPFIDITVNQDLIGSFNGLEVSGILIFFIVLIKYFKRGNNADTFNHTLMLIFIAVQILSNVLALFSGTQNILYASKFFLKFLNGYFIYFIAADELMMSALVRVKFYKVAWYTGLTAGIITIFVYATGLSNSDVTRGVTRYNGLYNDPGTPSYLSIITLLFANLYMDYVKPKKMSVETFLYYTVWVTTFYILYITMTKSALIMFVLYLLLWYGWHKRKAYIVLPGLVLGTILSFSLSESLNTRFETEFNYIESGGDGEAAKSIGTGRVNRWESLFDYFDQFDLPTKLLGTAHTFNAHNQYIAYLMQCGIIGLILFVLILVRFTSKLYNLYNQSNSPVIFAAFSLLVMYIIYGFTGHPFGYTTLLWYLMVLLAIINVFTIEQKRSFLVEKQKLQLRNRQNIPSYT